MGKPAGLNRRAVVLDARRSGDRVRSGRRGARPAGADARGIVLEDGGDDAVVIIELGSTNNAPLASQALASEGRHGGDLHLQYAGLADQPGGGFVRPLLP